MIGDKKTRLKTSKNDNIQIETVTDIIGMFKHNKTRDLMDYGNAIYSDESFQKVSK